MPKEVHMVLLLYSILCEMNTNTKIIILQQALMGMDSAIILTSIVFIKVF